MTALGGLVSLPRRESSSFRVSNNKEKSIFRPHPECCVTIGSSYLLCNKIQQFWLLSVFPDKNWNGPYKTISFCTTIILVLGPLSSHKYLRSVDDVARVAPIVSTIFFFHLPCRPYYIPVLLFFFNRGSSAFVAIYCSSNRSAQEGRRRCF